MFFGRYLRHLEYAVERLILLDVAFSVFCLNNSYIAKCKTLCKVMSYSGNGPFYVLLAIAALIIDSGSGRDFLIVGLAAFAIELPIYWLTKNTVKRRRPADYSLLIEARVTAPDKYSLPSGHAAAAFVMATLIEHFYPSLSAFSLFCAVAIASSRVLLGVHFLTDVIIGGVLGTVSTIVAIQFIP